MNRFASMGCEVVVEGATAEELARIQALFAERDAVFSRFRTESELNAVNAGRGAERRRYAIDGCYGPNPYATMATDS